MVCAQQTSSRLPSAHINPQNINDLLSLFPFYAQYLDLLRAPTGRLTKNRPRDSVAILTLSVKTTFCHTYMSLIKILKNDAFFEQYYTG